MVAPKLLTPKQAAERIGCSVSLVYQLAEERRITHLRVGGKGKRGKLLVDPRDVDRFLEGAGSTPGDFTAASR